MLRHIEDLPPELLCSIIGEFSLLIKPYDRADGLDYLALRGHCNLKPGELELKINVLSCSLVCRTWREVALPLLFRTLRLKVSPEGRGRSLSDALKWLKSVPHICGCVKEVQFTVPLAEVLASDFPYDDLQHFSLPLLYSVLAMFPNLQEVAMQDILLKPDMSMDLPEHFLHLNRFSFIFRYRSLQNMCLTDVLCLFPWLWHVKRMSLHGISGLQPCLPVAKALTGFHIDCLDLSMVNCIHGLTQFLASTSSFRASGLRCLNLNLRDEVEEEGVEGLLSLVAPQLQELHCNVEWFISSNARTRLDLSRFVALTKLRLMFSIIRGSADEENHINMSALANIFSSLTLDYETSSRLQVEHVTMALVLDDWEPDPNRKITARYLASTCAAELVQIEHAMLRLKMLKDFKVMRHGRVTNGFERENQAAFRSAFPALHERGILSF